MIKGGYKYFWATFWIGLITLGLVVIVFSPSTDTELNNEEFKTQHDQRVSSGYYEEHAMPVPFKLSKKIDHSNTPQPCKYCSGTKIRVTQYSHGGTGTQRCTWCDGLDEYGFYSDAQWKADQKKRLGLANRPDENYRQSCERCRNRHSGYVQCFGCQGTGRRRDNRGYCTWCGGTGLIPCNH